MGTTDRHQSTLIPSQSSEVLGSLSSPGRQFPFEIICTMGSNRSSHADTRFIQKPSTAQLLRSSFWSFNQNSIYWVLETIWKKSGPVYPTVVHPIPKQSFSWQSQFLLPSKPKCGCVVCISQAGSCAIQWYPQLNADTIIPRPIQQIRPIQSELILLPAVSHTLAPQPFIEIDR